MNIVTPIKKEDYADDKPYGYLLALYPKYDAHFNDYMPRCAVIVSPDSDVWYTFAITSTGKYIRREHGISKRYGNNCPPDGLITHHHTERLIASWQLLRTLFSAMEKGNTIYYT